MYRIEAELLIPGHGQPVRGGVVVLDGARIGYAGPATTAPPTPDAAVSQVAAVMPGMWDCHGHFFGTRTFDLGRLVLEPLSLRGVSYRPIGASALLRRNLLIYGLGGLIAPFVGIKLIDLIVHNLLGG